MYAKNIMKNIDIIS